MSEIVTRDINQGLTLESFGDRVVVTGFATAILDTIAALEVNGDPTIPTVPTVPTDPVGPADPVDPATKTPSEDFAETGSRATIATLIVSLLIILIGAATLVKRRRRDTPEA